jgi:hypothetical protein
MISPDTNMNDATIRTRGWQKSPEARKWDIVVYLPVGIQSRAEDFDARGSRIGKPFRF